MSKMVIPEMITLGEVARRVGCELWKVRRLYERGLLPEPPRCGRFRMVTADDVPTIRAALLQHGYLK